MSSILYGRATRPSSQVGAVLSRTAESSTAEVDKATTDVDGIVKAVSALVPAEALVIHAAIIGFVYDTKTEKLTGDVTSELANERLGQVGWLVLAALTVALFLFGHLSSGWKKPSSISRWLLLVGRAIIPAFAFAAWTLLQQPTMIDTLINWSEGTRLFIGLVLGALIAAVSSSIK